jgi:hypothetical protein
LISSSRFDADRSHGALFGAYHPPPTGPLGAICFLAAAAYREFAGNRAQEPAARLAA